MLEKNVGLYDTSVVSRLISVLIYVNLGCYRS